MGGAGEGYSWHCQVRRHQVAATLRREVQRFLGGFSHTHRYEESREVGTQTRTNIG